ncbi:probetacellulin isoform 3-T3 [Menidia menidia]
MANVLRLYTGILTALALCKYCRAEWNSTESANRTVSLCRLHGNHNNCTETGQWHGHFSTCPKELSYYCVHGECRYIKEQKAPSCRAGTPHGSHRFHLHVSTSQMQTDLEAGQTEGKTGKRDGKAQHDGHTHKCISRDHRNDEYQLKPCYSHCHCEKSPT